MNTKLTTPVRNNFRNAMGMVTRFIANLILALAGFTVAVWTVNQPTLIAVTALLTVAALWTIGTLIAEAINNRIRK
jgi:hypothetical protein